MIVWMSVTSEGLPGEALGAVATHNRYCLLGLDAAGNVIRGVRVSSRMPAVYWPSFGSMTERTAALYGDGFDWRFYDGVRSDGTPWLLWKDDGQAIENVENPIRVFYAAPDGRIYCAMRRVYQANHMTPKTGVTAAMISGAFAAYTASQTTEDYNAYMALFEKDYRAFYTHFFRVYREGGNQVEFPEVHDRPISAVYADDDYLYIAGDPNDDDIFLRKLDLAGNLVWEAVYDSVAPQVYYTPPGPFGSSAEYNYPEWEFRLFVASDGSVYVTGLLYEQSYYALGSLVTKHTALFFRKYNSSGVLQWERRLFGGVMNANSKGFYWPYTNMVSDGTDIYLAHTHVRKYYDEDDVEHWIDPLAESWASLTQWNSSGSVVGFAATPYTSTTYFPGTQEEYTLITPNHYPTRRITLSDGYLYLSNTGYEAIDIDYLVYIYDIATLTIQPLNLTTTQYSIGKSTVDSAPRFAFDSTENQYFACAVYPYGAGTAYWHVFDAAGAALWTSGFAVAANDPRPFIFDVQVIENTLLPALAFPIYTGRPTWEGDRYTSIDGLALVFSLAVPRLIRDYVGALRPTIYRLFLDGSPPLELPVISVSIRRNAAECSLNVVIAPPSLEMLDAIEARNGNDLILYRGVRFAADNEQLDILLQTPLTGIRSDRGGRSLRVSLDGKASEAEAEGQPRTIQGISYRSMNEGLRRVRCDVDTYLRPGDVADLGGGEFLTVAEIVIAVGTDNAFMEINEAVGS